MSAVSTQNPTMMESLKEFASYIPILLATAIVLLGVESSDPGLGHDSAGHTAQPELLSGRGAVRSAAHVPRMSAAPALS